VGIRRGGALFISLLIWMIAEGKDLMCVIALRTTYGGG
jgi:hypothetical protein